MNTTVIDYTNFKREHLCCVLRDRKGEGRIAAKRDWLEKVFEDGLVLRKGDVNGRVFLEYMPAEYCWFPVDAPGYMFIHCYRIDEKFENLGYEEDLWRECIAESRIKHKKGLCVIVGRENLPNLNRRDDFLERGFKECDRADPYFELMYLPFNEGEADTPRFMEGIEDAEVDDGWVLFYSHQCPHTAKIVERLKKKAGEAGIELKTVLLEKQKETGRIPLIPSVYTTFALFKDGRFITHEMLSPAKFAKIIKGKAEDKA